MKRSIFTFMDEPRGQLLQRLLAYAATQSNRVGVVVCEQLPREASLEAALRELEPFLMHDEVTREWPGTQLLGHDARVFHYRVEAALIEVLSELSDSLYAWRQPELPEDPFLLRPDGSALLTTISHEEDAYLELSRDELSALGAADPQIAAILRRDHDAE